MLKKLIRHKNITQNKKRKSTLLGALFLCFSFCYSNSLFDYSQQQDSIAQNLELSDTLSKSLVDSAILIVNEPQIEVDSLNEDLKNVKRSEKRRNDSVSIVYKEHSPKRAVLLSKVVPGMGQVYNKKYWKLPLFYGAGAVLYYYYDLNNDYYQRFRTSIFEYKENDSTEDINDGEMKDIAEKGGVTALEINRDNYRRNRDYNLIFFGMLYFANIVDAMVDAHMLYYDVSDNLSVQLTPDIQPIYHNKSIVTSSLGIGINFKLK